LFALHIEKKYYFQSDEVMNAPRSKLPKAMSNSENNLLQCIQRLMECKFASEKNHGTHALPPDAPDVFGNQQGQMIEGKP
jgi:hypothetical protein